MPNHPVGTLTRVTIKDTYSGQPLIVPNVMPSITRWYNNKPRNACPRCGCLANLSTKLGVVDWKSEEHNYRCAVRKCVRCKTPFYVVILKTVIKKGN